MPRKRVAVAVAQSKRLPPPFSRYALTKSGDLISYIRYENGYVMAVPHGGWVRLYTDDKRRVERNVKKLYRQTWGVDYPVAEESAPPAVDLDNPLYNADGVPMTPTRDEYNALSETWRDRRVRWLACQTHMYGRLYAVRVEPRLLVWVRLEKAERITAMTSTWFMLLNPFILYYENGQGVFLPLAD